MYENLAILAIFAFIYSVIAGKVERTAITGPIIFITFGLLAGPVGIGLLEVDVNNVQLRVIADMTLALILFIDAANADLYVLKTHFTDSQAYAIAGAFPCALHSERSPGSSCSPGSPCSSSACLPPCWQPLTRHWARVW